MIIMTAPPIEAPTVEERELIDKLAVPQPMGDGMKVQYLRAKVGAFVIVSGDIAVLGACIFALWLTHATYDVVAAVLTSAFAAIASMTSAYFGIRAASNAAQGVTTPQAPAATTSRAASATHH